MSLANLLLSIQWPFFLNTITQQQQVKIVQKTHTKRQIIFNNGAGISFTDSNTKMPNLERTNFFLQRRDDIRVHLNDSILLFYYLILTLQFLDFLIHFEFFNSQKMMKTVSQQALKHLRGNIQSINQSDNCFVNIDFN